MIWLIWGPWLCQIDNHLCWLHGVKFVKIPFFLGQHPQFCCFNPGNRDMSVGLCNLWACGPSGGHGAVGTTGMTAQGWCEWLTMAIRSISWCRLILIENLVKYIHSWPQLHPQAWCNGSARDEDRVDVAKIWDRLHPDFSLQLHS